MLEPMPSSSKSTASSSKNLIQLSQVSSSQSHTKSKQKDSSKSSHSKSKSSTPVMLTVKAKLAPLEDLSKDLPPPPENIIPNDYKPMPVNPMVMDFVFKQSAKPQPFMMNEAAALCASTTSKNMRTKVYSGVKTGALLTVPSLHEVRIQISNPFLSLLNNFFFSFVLIVEHSFVFDFCKKISML